MYLQSDRHRTPISVKRFRVLEEFPTRTRHAEQRPMTSRLSRVYLQKACTANVTCRAKSIQLRKKSIDKIVEIR